MGKDEDKQDVLRLEVGRHVVYAYTDEPKEYMQGDYIVYVIKTDILEIIHNGEKVQCIERFFCGNPCNIINEDIRQFTIWFRELFMEAIWKSVKGNK